MEEQNARFTPESSVTLIYGPPGRGKSYLLRQMYEDPPVDELGNSLVNGVVVFTSVPKDWEGIEKICVRDWDVSVMASLMMIQKKKKNTATHSSYFR